MKGMNIDEKIEVYEKASEECPNFYKLTSEFIETYESDEFSKEEMIEKDYIAIKEYPNGEKTEKLLSKEEVDEWIMNDLFSTEDFIQEVCYGLND